MPSSMLCFLSATGYQKLLMRSCRRKADKRFCKNKFRIHLASRHGHQIDLMTHWHQKYSFHLHFLQFPWKQAQKKKHYVLDFLLWIYQANIICLNSVFGSAIHYSKSESLGRVVIKNIILLIRLTRSGIKQVINFWPK